MSGRISQTRALSVRAVTFQENCRFTTHVRNKLIKANKCLLILRSLIRREDYTQAGRIKPSVSKQLLDEVFVISTETSFVLLYIERILSLSLRHKMFSKFVPTFSFPLSRHQQTAPLPPSSTFLCLWVLVFNRFFDALLYLSCLVNEANLEDMFLLLHWRQATQSARTWHDYP